MRLVGPILLLSAMALWGCERDEVRSDEDATVIEEVHPAVQMCRDTGSCADCQECANQNPCTAMRVACESSAVCSGLLTCNSGCSSDDADCLVACSEQYGEGREALQAWLTCVICDVCDVHCAVPSCQ